MYRKKVKHRDGSVETWDDETGLYVHKDSAGHQIEKRALTPEECNTLDPASPQVSELAAILDQLILDMLLGGM